MLKRLFWLSLGMAIGLATSFWLYRAIRETVERYMPEHIASEVSSALQSLRTQVEKALAEGRDAARRTEAELRAELGARLEG
ncbi:MAG TPA: hypothetical protein VHF00_06140 [Acidimicrobiales bacterium]|nr:hypothetical protein [Acidimicrobiales bacterium]